MGAEAWFALAGAIGVPVLAWIIRVERRLYRLEDRFMRLQATIDDLTTVATATHRGVQRLETYFTNGGR